MTIAQMQTELASKGFVIGARDERINTDYAGKFMVAEAYGESELPTQNACQGPWAIVGDDLDALIQEAYESLLP